jgi:quercetin dioxygenase-like cupin family protein
MPCSHHNFPRLAGDETLHIGGSRFGRDDFDAGRRVTDTPPQNGSVFTQEVRKISGKHRHQGGLVIYVIDGPGRSGRR